MKKFGFSFVECTPEGEKIVHFGPILQIVLKNLHKSATCPIFGDGYKAASKKAVAKYDNRYVLNPIEQRAPAFIHCLALVNPKNAYFNEVGTEYRSGFNSQNVRT